MSASDKKFVNKPTGEESSTSRSKVTEISGVEGFRESLQMEEILSNAAKLISHSRRKRCNERQINFFQASVNYIINFLPETFDEGLQHRTLNS